VPQFHVNGNGIYQLRLCSSSSAIASPFLTISISESEVALFPNTGESSISCYVLHSITRGEPLPGDRNYSNIVPESEADILPCVYHILHSIGMKGKKDGIVTTPFHITHAIMLYRRFWFIDPVQEGFIRKILYDCGGDSKNSISWKIPSGTIVNTITGLPHIYYPSPQLHPLSAKAERSLDSDHYNSIMECIMEENTFITHKNRNK